MIHIGEYNELEVEQLTPYGALLRGGIDEVLLPTKWVPAGLQVGEVIRVFVYNDSEDEPIATLAEPKATVGQFALLKVVDSAPHGLFLDWGLEKDVFVPPREMHQRLEVGDERVFYLSLHERTNRVIASSRLGRHFDYNIDVLSVKQRVQLLVYGFNEFGAHVVVNGRFRGIVYHNEVFQALRIGMELTGWIKELREDNRLDIVLQRQGRAATLDARETILQELEAEGGFLPLHDKSDPKAISKRLGMSKGVFKKAIGGLFREELITLLPTGIQRRE
ncbi:MAG: GntR family transcriptional regulator [Proteobacteria bacterium]|nr:GntR family transcriptional regulator [Pseudomonadota bacterium]